jgi:hypothetical protein
MAYVRYNLHFVVIHGHLKHHFGQTDFKEFVTQESSFKFICENCVQLQNSFMKPKYIFRCRYKLCVKGSTFKSKNVLPNKIKTLYYAYFLHRICCF